MSKFNNILELKLVLNNILTMKFDKIEIYLRGSFKLFRINKDGNVEYLEIEESEISLKILNKIDGIRILDKLPNKIATWVSSSKGFDKGYSSCCLEYVDNIKDVSLIKVVVDDLEFNPEWLDVSNGIEIPKFIDWCCDNVGANTADFVLLNNDKRLNLIYQEGVIIRKSFYKGERSVVNLSNADNFDTSFKDCPLVKLNFGNTNLSLMSMISSWEVIAGKQCVDFKVNDRFLKNS